MSLNVGDRLGSYEVTARIGAGGMGEVYRAVDTNLKRAVAIKVLPDPLTSDPERLARFQREAEILASLDHPHIAHVHGLQKSGGQAALVMELSSVSRGRCVYFYGVGSHHSGSCLVALAAAEDTLRVCLLSALGYCLP